MNSVINPQNLRQFAYVNEAVLRRPVCGIAIEFMGLGGVQMFDSDSQRARHYGENGIAMVIPYLNPWCWMNDSAIVETDEIIAALKLKLGLENVPVVSSGGSMGGLCALTYSRYAKETPVACVANCPVCDLPYHYTERPDLPRTLYSAFYACNDSDIVSAMERYSPLHIAQNGKMPHIKYRIFHCTADKAVDKRLHSDKLVSALNGRDVKYYEVEGRGHCDLTPEMTETYETEVINATVQIV